jgi:hypothetical protein
MDRPEIAQYTTLDFMSWREAGTLLLTPKFQRREVWKTPARAFFIDSLLRQMPVPPLLIRIGQSADRRRSVREVIDGQQRLRAVLDYVDDKYPLTKSLNSPNAGKRYSALGEADQNAINTYSFLCEVFKNIPDAEVLEIFARVNTYSVGLNAQELRNGRYFGHFKQTAYSLALEHLEVWRRHNILSEAGIARMLEVELTSELLVAMRMGQQDKKASLDRVYADLDEAFPQKKATETRFRGTIDAINEAFPESLCGYEFHRPPMFYTLFCVVFHYLFGMPEEAPKSPQRKTLNRDEAKRLNAAVLSLSDTISSVKQGEAVAASEAAFVNACLRQTDNIKPRRVRFSRLYREAFSA